MSQPGGVTESGGLLLVRATELTGRPVVSITEGDALADIKDIVYSPDTGRLLGFSLNKRGGIFAGPLKIGLPLTTVRAIGRDAVMIDSAAALEAGPSAKEQEKQSGIGNVLGNNVLTDAGNRLGVVTDLVVNVGRIDPNDRVDTTTPGDVVGYQLKGDEALQGRAGHNLFIPLPYTLSVSGTNLVVPASVQPYIRDDLSGFGGAVSDFRALLDRGGAGQQNPGATS